MHAARKLYAFAAATMLAAGSVASAATISFNTSGPTIALGGGAQLSYSGTAHSIDTSALPITDFSLNYGEFHVTGLTSTPIPASPISYTITITETSPDNGSAAVLGTITGQIMINTSTLQWNSGLGLANIYFTPAADSVTAVHFQLAPTNIGVSATGATEGFGFVNGNLSVEMTRGGETVPLPAAAWGGMSLMGVLGGLRAIRRRALAR